MRVQICLVCFANVLGILYWLFNRRIWINSCLRVMNLIAIFSFCTQLTFNLILRFRCISRLGIHPYGWWHTSRYTISMDATFYSILPSEEFFHGMDCQLWVCTVCPDLSVRKLRNNRVLFKWPIEAKYLLAIIYTCISVQHLTKIDSYR